MVTTGMFHRSLRSEWTWNNINFVNRAMEFSLSQENKLNIVSFQYEPERNLHLLKRQLNLLKITSFLKLIAPLPIHQIIQSLILEDDGIVVAEQPHLGIDDLRLNNNSGYNLQTHTIKNNERIWKRRFRYDIIQTFITLI